MPLYMVFAALLISVSLPHIRGRSRILFANLSLAALFAVTMYLYDLHVASMIYVVVVLGSGSQIIMSNSDNKKIKILRTLIACTLVGVGSCLLYHSPLDLLAITGFAISRMCETLKKPWQIKAGYMMGTCAYMGYSILNHVWLITGIQMVFFTSLLIALSLEHFKKTDLLTIFGNFRARRMGLSV